MNAYVTLASTQLLVSIVIAKNPILTLEFSNNRDHMNEYKT